MTDPQNGMTLEEAASNAQLMIEEFHTDEGLELRVESHLTGTNGDDFLEITGRSRMNDGVHAFSYRATRSDLEDHGDGWFTRKALRSLNDMFRAGHLPPVQDRVDHQTLKPGGEYTDEPYRS